MNIRDLLLVCLVAGTMANAAENLGSAYGSVLDRLHSHMRCVDTYYRRMKAAAFGTISQMLSSVHNRVRPRKQRKTQTLEEFEKVIDGISKKARRNAEKEKELEAKKEVL